MLYIEHLIFAFVAWTCMAFLWKMEFCMLCTRFEDAFSCSLKVKILIWVMHFRSSISDLWIKYKGVLITSLRSEERFSFFPHPLGSVYISARWYQGWVLQQTQDDAESKLPDAITELRLFGTSCFVIQMCYTADVCVANKMECFESILNYHVKECGWRNVIWKLLHIN
jgi:hypothetical protein